MYLSVLALVFITFIILVFTDPGYVSNKYQSNLLMLVESKEKVEDYCPTCVVNQKKKTVKHCYVCDKCVENYDHHCIWVNNCIGKKNINCFRFFLVITMINLGLHFFISYAAFRYLDLVNQFLAGVVIIVTLSFFIPVT